MTSQYEWNNENYENIFYSGTFSTFSDTHFSAHVCVRQEQIKSS